MFKIKKEERLIVLIALIVFVAFNALVIYKYSPLFLKGGNLGFWTIFSKNFRISGYDCWSYITLSNLRVHFETTRHPLFLTLLYPMYLANHWLMQATGTNFAVFFMMAVVVFCAVYSAIFMYRIFREVLSLTRPDATLLTAFFFSFGHVFITTMVPDHFVISLFLLTLTLYAVGMRMKQSRAVSEWEAMLLVFLTAGITLTNGAKTLLACLFSNGRRVFSFRFILISFILPAALLGGIWYWQYRTVEIPQKIEIENMAKKQKKQGKEEKMRKWADSRNKWMAEHSGKPVSKLPLLSMTDVTTPRGKTIVENFFGEPIQLHKSHLLEDMSHTRPVFVSYDNALPYVIEAIIVLLFVIGVLCGLRNKFLLMCLSWFAVDVMLHLVLGFGINEVYIMSADWIFIIPIAIGCLLSILARRPATLLRYALCALTVWLWAYNGTLIVGYLVG